MKFPSFALVLVLLALLTGCVGPPAPKPQPPSTANSHFELVVEWAAVDTPESQGLSASAAGYHLPVANAQAGDFAQLNVGYNLSATHVGVRLEYQDKNRVFFESVERAVGDARGSILIPEVPEGRVRVIVAAVHKGGGEEYGRSVALWYGVLPNLQIIGGTVTRITIQDIQQQGMWMRPAWEIAEPVLAALYSEGNVVFTRSSCLNCFDELREVFWLPIRGVNPLAYEGRNPAYGRPEIMHARGRSSRWGLEEMGWDHMSLGCPRELTVCSLGPWPYSYPILKYELFALPVADYLILPEVRTDIRVEWD